MRGLAALFLACFATVAFAAPTFPKLTSRVVDGAQMLSPASEEKLTSELAALEAKTGHQLVVATVPDLPGCMSDGETPEEALKNVQEAIASWIEAAKEWKQDVPKPSPPLARAG